MKKKIGMIFPGYGSQFVGMGKELYDASRTMQEYFDQASIVLENNLVKLCFASSDEDIGKIQNAYTLIFLVSASIAQLLRDEGIVPDIVAGYNTGEFAAAHVASGIDFVDTLYLLNKYALAYTELLPEMGNSVMMRVTGIETERLEEIIHEVEQATGSTVPIALYHHQTEHFIGGFQEPVTAVAERIGEAVKRAKCKPSNHAIGYHSTLMDSVVNRLLMYAEKVDFHDLSIPWVSSIGGQTVQTKELLREQLLGTINRPLYWRQSLEQFADCDILIEVGPGNSLRSQLEERYPDKVIRSVNKPEDIAELTLVLNGEVSTPTTETENGNL
jgi:[acyl-carrier-protein] S-malonyltransferase